MYFFITYELEAIFLIHVCIFSDLFVGILVQCVFSQWVLDYFESFQSIRSTVQFFHCMLHFFFSGFFLFLGRCRSLLFPDDLSLMQCCIIFASSSKFLDSFASRTQLRVGDSLIVNFYTQLFPRVAP